MLNTTVISSHGRFTVQEYTGMLMGEPLHGFGVWDDNDGESVGPGMVATLKEAELLLECGQASELLDALRLAKRLNRH